MLCAVDGRETQGRDGFESLRVTDLLIVCFVAKQLGVSHRSACSNSYRLKDLCWFE